MFTDPRMLTIRIDESLTYLNARWLEEFVLEQVAEHPDAAPRHPDVLARSMRSTLRRWKALRRSTTDCLMAGVKLHLSEVKGPVMDALEKSHLFSDLTGQVFLSQNEAFDAVVEMANQEDTADTPPDAQMNMGLI